MQLALVFFLPLEFAHWGMKLKEPWKRPIIVWFQPRGHEKVLLHDTSCTTMHQMGSPISMFLTRGICYTWGWASRGWPAGYCFCKPWCRRAISTKGWQWLLMPTTPFVRSGKSTPSCGEWTFTPSEGGGSNEATGSWNKAAMTSNWMRFLEDYCNEKIDLDTVSQKIRVFVSCLH